MSRPTRTPRPAAASRPPSATPVPGATYRLQLHAGFDFDAAASLVPYLADLGVTHLYCSPILQAVPGSPHGYDVVDHARISSDLGGREGFDRLVAAARAAGLGMVVDVVPNHMAIVGEGNAWWWDVLEHGHASRYAAFFDVDWDPPESRLRNVILLPVLPDHYGRVLDAGGIRLVRDATRLLVAVGERRLPLDPRSLGPLIERAAELGDSDELAFIGRALGELPPSTASDPADVERRQADAAVLGARLQILSEVPRLARALDRVVAARNADAEALDRLLEDQNYRLAFWRAASRDLGYRRFFDIDTLIGLRVERPEVFEATHALIADLVAEGQIDGLRVDHPDGLRDPAGYFERLRARAPGAWIVAEKILIGEERLRDDWPIDGGTGYAFADRAAGLLVDPAGEEPLTRRYHRFVRDHRSWGEVAVEARLEVLSGGLGSDLNRLTHLFLEVCEANRRYRDFTRHDLHDALREVAAHLPVYRTYVRRADPDPGAEPSVAAPSAPEPSVAAPSAPGPSVAAEDRAAVDLAVRSAMEARPDLDPDLLDLLRSLLLLQVPGERPTELALRFQQLTPAAMAKGVEDTAFYRYVRFVARNEVGSQPDRLAIRPDAAHAAFATDAARCPGALLATSTHDTKRSGDVRARLALISEIPAAWGRAVSRLATLAAAHRTPGGVPDRHDEYLLYQTLLGAWPLDAERAVDFARKAAREAKLRTSWTAPDEPYEAGLERFVRGVLGDAAFAAELERFVAPLVEPGRTNALSQTLLKLTAPGVPDLYQGTELWNLSLVDPDNRRPVDYERRRAALRALDGAGPEEALAGADAGLPKLWLIRQALDLRRRRPETLAPGAGYAPLAALGARAGHAFAYLRGDAAIAVAPRLVLRLARTGGWSSTVLPLPPGRWRNVLDGTEHAGLQHVAMGELLARFPVALLERTG